MKDIGISLGEFYKKVKLESFVLLHEIRNHELEVVLKVLTGV